MDEVPHAKRKTKPTGPTSARKQEQISEHEQRHAIYRGATISDLEIIFRMDRRTIVSRIADHVKPNGRRSNGGETFAIREVAPYLVKPAGDLAEFAARARPGDLPPTTLKEYWNGRRAKQIFMVEDAQLWRVERIMETVAEAFKTIRGILLLIPDDLALKGTVTEEQRQSIQDTIDGALETMNATLVKQFGGPVRPEDAPGVDNDLEQEDEDDDFWADPATPDDETADESEDSGSGDDETGGL